MQIKPLGLVLVQVTDGPADDVVGSVTSGASQSPL
jgi:hypothetical protein